MATFTAVIQLINQLIPVILDLAKLYQEGKLKGWINDGRGLRNKIDEAKTDEEKKVLIKSIFEHRAS